MLSALADVAEILTAVVGMLFLWQWIIDKSRPKKIDGLEDAFEAALDEHGER